MPYDNKEITASLAVYFDEKKWLELKDLFPNTLKARDEYVTEAQKIAYNDKKLQKQMSSPDQKVTPDTSIPVERAFSALKDIKNQKHNRLTYENVEALLLEYQHFRSNKSQ